jgi:hypothetical protein
MEWCFFGLLPMAHFDAHTHRFKTIPINYLKQNSSTLPENKG